MSHTFLHAFPCNHETLFSSLQLGPLDISRAYNAVTFQIYQNSACRAGSRQISKKGAQRPATWSPGLDTWDVASWCGCVEVSLTCACIAELVLLPFPGWEYCTVELILTGNIYFFKEPKFLLNADIYFGDLIAVDMETEILELCYQLPVSHTHQQSVSS